MQRRWLYGGLGLAMLLALAANWISAAWDSSRDVLPHHAHAPIEAAPLCPWRQPEADMRAFFHDATGYRTEVRILSGARLELARRLGRPPAPDEHSLYVHRVYHQQHLRGSVLTSSVKGESGAIEIVVGVGTNGAVRGVRLQRLREPDTVSGVLRSSHWLATFAGKKANDNWQLGAGIPSVPPEARPSARAVVEGVRCRLILLETAERYGLTRASSEHT